MASDATSNTLQRVAHALGVSVDTFSSPSVHDQIGSAAQALQDRSELLEMFAKIEDPFVRRECIDVRRQMIWDGLQCSGAEALVHLG